MSLREEAKLVDRLTGEIKPMLAGHPPQVQGAAIADLMAIFLAGLQGPGVEGLREREHLLRRHVELVRELVAYYDAERADAASKNGGVA